MAVRMNTDALRLETLPVFTIVCHVAMVLAMVHLCCLDVDCFVVLVLSIMMMPLNSMNWPMDSGVCLRHAVANCRILCCMSAAVVPDFSGCSILK